MFEITDRVKEAKEERRIRLERKQQDKEKYLGGMRLQAVWEED